MKTLLEALAGARSPGDRCQFCHAPENTPVQQIDLSAHAESCPKRQAAVILLSQGTPLKIWKVSYHTRKNSYIGNAEQLVMRCEMSEQDALTYVTRILQGKRHLVPGSVRIEDLGIVPCQPTQV